MGMGLLLLVYCTLIVLSSLSGGWLPSLVRLTHTRMQLLISLVSGLMLGVALFHLLPHAALLLPSMGWATFFTMVGLLGMFFLIRMFHFHQHDFAEDAPQGEHDHDHSHLHDHAHQDHAHEHHDHKHEDGGLSWVGLLIGLGLHTAVDGVALGASVYSEGRGHAELSLFGMATFLAIVLHKPLDALSITSLMKASGWSLRVQSLVNMGFALMCPLGAVLFCLTAYQLDQKSMVLGASLAFSAGAFLCISLGDLLPEVHFHRHDRLKLSIALLFGVVLAWGIEHLPGHQHGAPPNNERPKAIDE